MPLPPLPKPYGFLNDIAILPRMTTEAISLLGVVETPGPRTNPAILGWAKELGLEHQYTADAIPWCGLFMAVVAKRAGKTPPDHPLWALNWSNFGEPAGQPCLGDVLVFTRNGGGHVTQYVAEDSAFYHCVGGNQHDEVCFTRIEKKRLHAARRPIFAAGAPLSRRPYIINAAGGVISHNEL